MNNTIILCSFFFYSKSDELQYEQCKIFLNHNIKYFPIVFFSNKNIEVSTKTNNQYIFIETNLSEINLPHIKHKYYHPKYITSAIVRFIQFKNFLINKKFDYIITLDYDVLLYNENILEYYKTSKYWPNIPDIKYLNCPGQCIWKGTKNLIDFGFNIEKCVLDEKFKHILMNSPNGDNEMTAFYNFHCSKKDLIIDNSVLDYSQVIYNYWPDKKDFIINNKIEHNIKNTINGPILINNELKEYKINMLHFYSGYKKFMKNYI